jgi:hypothetical protein
MKNKPALIVESPFPVIFSLTPDEVSFIAEMHHAWHDHLKACDDLSPAAVEKRHADADAAVRRKRCAETVAAFRALPDIATDKKRSADLALIITDELNATYREKWQPAVSAACRRIAGEVRKWLNGYGEEMRPRFEAMNLPFSPILAGAPYDLAKRIIHACETFADNPERDFTQLTDVTEIIVREKEVSA